MDLIIKNASLEEITTVCARLGEPGIKEIISDLTDEEYKKAETKTLLGHKPDFDQKTESEKKQKQSSESDPEPTLHLEPTGVTRKQVIDKALLLAHSNNASKLKEILKMFDAPKVQKIEDKDLEEAFNQLTKALDGAS